MLNSYIPDSHGMPPMPLLFAADLQDHLMTASHDLDRLQALLAHACDALLHGFHGAAGETRNLVDAARVSGVSPSPARFDGLMRHLGGAITALQFQDMASQLIAHTHQRLRHCADRLARETMGGDDDSDDDADGAAVVEAAPLRPNPVTQDEMDAGSVELF